jgi:hypothetical protein
MPDLPLDWFLLLLRAIFIFLLYFFLYQLVRVTTRELIALAGTMPEAQQGRRAVGQLPDRLVLLDPGDSLLLPGTAFSLQPISLVGRHPDCTVALDEPFISTEHAELTLRQGRWWLRDLDSTNGTFVNGKEVRGTSPVGAEDVVQFGRVKLRLVR